MLKRILMIVLAFAVFIGGFIYIHHSMQSKVEATYLNYAQVSGVESVEYADSQVYMQSKTGQYLLLFSGDDSESKYLEESILPDVSENINISLIYVNMSAVSDFGSTRFKSAWNFETYPAFAYVSVENNTITIHSVIESKDDNPITISTLKTWLNQNAIWRGTFE